MSIDKKIEILSGFLNRVESLVTHSALSISYQVSTDHALPIKADVVIKIAIKNIEQLESLLLRLRVFTLKESPFYLLKNLKTFKRLIDKMDFQDEKNGNLKKSLSGLYKRSKERLSNVLACCHNHRLTDDVIDAMLNGYYCHRDIKKIEKTQKDQKNQKTINGEVERDLTKSFLKNETPTDILKGSMLGFLDSILILREGILFLFQQIKKHEEYTIPEIQITNLLNGADIFVKYGYAFNYDSFINDFE